MTGNGRDLAIAGVLGAIGIFAKCFQDLGHDTRCTHIIDGHIV